MSHAPASPLALRVRLATFVASAVLASLCARAAWLQLVRGARHQELRRQQLHEVVRDLPMRGILRDAHGSELATNCLAYDVFIEPSSRRSDLRAQVARALSSDPASLPRWSDRKPGALVRLARGIEVGDPGALRRLGMSAHKAWVRHYPFGPLAAHVVGYLNEVTPEEVAQPSHVYRSGDRIGRSGVEQMMESVLRGTDGQHLARSGPRSPAAPAGTTRNPVDGMDVELTIDLELTAAIDDAFATSRVRTGAAVVLEAATGRLLALYSRPSFDPNAFSSSVSEGFMAALQDDPDLPQLDRSVSVAHAPGSLFKPWVGLAALQSGVAPGDRTTCSGAMDVGMRRYRCSGTHGPVNLRDALTRSCHSWFYAVSEKIGIDALAQTASDFGFGEAPGLALNVPVAGRVPAGAWLQSKPERNRTGHMLNTSIGQGAVQVTPLQVALAWAALANGGVVYTPQLVRRVRGRGQDRSFEPQVRHLVAVRPEHLATMRSMVLQANVQEAGCVPMAGLAGVAAVPRVAGDESPEGLRRNRDHAWFAAMAPVSDPRWVVVVLAEHSAVREAAAIARATVQKLGESSP